MRFKTKIIHTYEYIKLNGKKSLSKLSKLVNQSKSSLHRQTRVIDNRSNIPGADFFETAEGAIWLRRLVLAATLVFGLGGPRQFPTTGSHRSVRAHISAYGSSYERFAARKSSVSPLLVLSGTALAAS